jgi:hypothetical protein
LPQDFLSDLADPFSEQLHPDLTMSEHRDNSSPTPTGDIEKTHTYDGRGTKKDPFVVEFQRDDASNPMNWSQARKWFITAIVTMSVFIVTMASSAPSSTSRELTPQFHLSRIEFTLTISLFVLGFAIGPAFWGPMVRTFLFSISALLSSSSFRPHSVGSTPSTRTS